MMKNKSLDEIRPARGVKTSSRKVPPPPPRQTRPQVIKDVQPVAGDLPPPTEEAARFILESNRAREALIEAMKGFNRLMGHRVLPENKSIKESEEERAAVEALVNAAKAMEAISPGEGLLGMAILAVRQGLTLRDAGNHLAYELEQTRRDLRELRERLQAELGFSDTVKGNG
jgi:hypothetical protein